MEDGDSCPVLESCRKLQPEFSNFNKIPITSDNVSRVYIFELLL